MNGIDVPKYLPYFPVAPSFDVQSALLNLDLKLTYEDAGDLPSITIGGGITLKRLKAVDKRGNPLLAVPSLSVHGEAFDWRQRRLAIRQLESDGGKVHLIRYKDGGLNLLTLISFSGLKREEGGTARAGSPAKPWEVSLAGGTLQHYSASVEDRSTSIPVFLKAEELTLDLQELTTVEKKHGKISLSFR